jgi:hypothetical protein
MIFKTRRHLIGWLFLMALGGPITGVWGASQDVRPVSQFNGFIIAPVEERIQVLSSGDKIFVSLEKNRTVKKGDRLEIFQPTLLPGSDTKDFLFAKVGQAVILEIPHERLLVCEIVSSQKEMAVGDRIYWPEN